MTIKCQFCDDIEDCEPCVCCDGTGIIVLNTSFFSLTMIPGEFAMPKHWKLDLSECPF